MSLDHTQAPLRWRQQRLLGAVVGQVDKKSGRGSWGLHASLCPRMVIRSQGASVRADGMSGNCSSGLSAQRACSPAARSPLAMASPAPSLPPSWARDGCRHGNPAHSVQDNEANVFFISMSWRMSREGEGAFPSWPLLWGKRQAGESVGPDQWSHTH